MTSRRLVAIAAIAAIAAFLAALPVLRLFMGGTVPSGIVDPAIEFYTDAHDSGYAGIDRWAYYGMKVESLVEILEKNGFVCPLPAAPAAGDTRTGIREMACDKTVQWPFSRNLSIRASIDYGNRGRLVAANAASAVAAEDRSIRRYFANFLRDRGWIEPEHLQVRGFEVDSIETLSRLAVDALTSVEWHRGCGKTPSAAECAAAARERRVLGFPPLPQGAVGVGKALDIAPALERVRLMPTVQRGADAKPQDSLLVRVTEGQMWMDFAGRDLAGRELSVSIALASQGGAPVKLVAKVGTDTRVGALSGERRKANAGAMMFLVPEAGTQNPRMSTWLDLPNKNYPGTFKKLAEQLPNADPAFIPTVVKAVVTSLSTAERPDESLGLYPALRSIEIRAEALRLARAELWLPRDQSDQLIKDAYRDEPSIRAAWAMAICEPTATAAVLDAPCWQRFAASDPAAIALARGAVTELLDLYESLEPTHPVRLRLKRLNDVLQLQ